MTTTHTGKGRARCDECGRSFDLLDPTDAEEYAYGHDCKPAGDDDTDNHPEHDGLRAQHLDGWTCGKCDVAAEIEAGDTDDDEPDDGAVLIAGVLYDVETLDELPDGSDPDGPRTCDGQSCINTAEDGGVLCLSCIAAAVALDPGDAAAVDELAAGLTPEPMRGPGFIPAIDAWALTASDQRARHGAAWSSLLARSNQHRRALVARSSPDDTGHLRANLRRAAALSGLVPDWFDHDVAQRQYELVAVFGGWRAAAIGATWRYRATDVTDAGPISFRAWPGDRAADYDAGAERFELSPSGRWYRDMPPIYAAGRAQSITARPDANRPA